MGAEARNPNAKTAAAARDSTRARIVAIPNTMQPPRNRAPDADHKVGSGPRSTWVGVPSTMASTLSTNAGELPVKQRLDERFDEDEPRGDQ